ncbi:DNA-binding MarR family transcriptional regulator [Amorphus suaedae]
MAETGQDGATIGIGKRIRLAHMAFSRALRLELAKHDVSFGQFVHLEQLWLEDGLTQTDLSHRIGIETASSTSILDQLEKRGFIERHRNDQDRRKINVFLTDSGSDLQPVLFGAVTRVNGIAQSNLSREQVQELFDTLDCITKSVSDAYPGPKTTDARARLGS